MMVFVRGFTSLLADTGELRNESRREAGEHEAFAICCQLWLVRVAVRELLERHDLLDGRGDRAILVHIDEGP